MIRRVVALLALTAIVLPIGMHAASTGEKAPSIKSKTWGKAKEWPAHAVLACRPGYTVWCGGR